MRGWIEDGAPLGIEVPIEVAGIFPLNTEESNLDFAGAHELEDAATQLSRGEMVNYASVQDNVNEAKIEMDRFRQRGFMVDVPKAMVESEMAHGTISRLGLIIKEKPEGVKRRIILDIEAQRWKSEVDAAREVGAATTQGRGGHDTRRLWPSTTACSRRKLRYRACGD